MIVRIFGEGQWTVDETQLTGLNELDAKVESAIEANDQEALTAALAALLDEVRTKGEPVPDEVLADSDLILPDSAMTIEQIKSFLDEQSNGDGLIPG